MKRTIILLTLFILVFSASASEEINKPAVFRSVLLPGWGEMSLGHTTRGYIFMGVEAATWIGCGLSYLEGVFYRDDYTWLACEDAGIDVSGFDSSFLDDIGDFGSNAEFNDYIRRLARYYYPDDPDAQRDYYESHARYGSEGWNWSSEYAMDDFAHALMRSRQWFRRSMYIAGFALVNRLVSAIDTALLDETTPGIYTFLEFPESSDFSSVRFVIGARF